MSRNEILINQILEMINTLMDASECMYSFAKKKDYIKFHDISSNMKNSLDSISRAFLTLNEKENIININLVCESIIDSLKRIDKFGKTRSEKLFYKIEFELIPLLQQMYLQLYFWGSVYGNKSKMCDYYKNEMIPLCTNKYIDESEKYGEYKYDISIVIVGYNKLEYTKICVESVLAYVSSNLNYELILVNHGSNDGTKEYFESISPTKQLDILKNGGGHAAFTRIVEGKYVLLISNDVIVTQNSIDNMIKCMESDDSIAWVVPTTPNVSNLQTIDSTYSNLEEMHEFAKRNNIHNPYFWEQRAKLCNPIDITRSRVFFSSDGIGISGYFHSNSLFSFPDDKQSLILRRNGYKMMLAKDSYCYHFGSVTLKDETKNYKDREGNEGDNTFYLQGRKDFYNVFGIDPWGTGFCWDPGLFQHLPCNEKGHIDILGINCGIGSNPLKVKESIKENVHNLDVKIYNITDEKCYIEDLKGVSDSAEYIENLVNIEDIINGMKFNYIIFESKMDIYNNPLSIFNKLFIHLEKGGFLSIKMSNTKVKKEIKKTCSNYREVGEWLIINNI